MNKRGQMYILAAVLLCIAIYGVMKVTNRLEMPVETNFDFYVENFKGERSYVVDYGLLVDGDRITGGNGLLDIFTKFGSGTGIIYAQYKNNVWTIINYLGKDIFINDEEERLDIPSGDVPAGRLEFGIGKMYILAQTQLGNVEGANNKKTLESDNIIIEFDGNSYSFTKPSQGNKVETILFQNVDKNYIRVVKI